LKIPHETSTSHGNAFLQTWLGFCCKHTTDIRLTQHRRTAKPALDAEMKDMLNHLDCYLSTAANRIRQLDEDIYNRMRVSHDRVARKALEAVDKADNEHGNLFAADPDSRRASSYRNRSLGTMLAISQSSGGGIDFHHDQGDDRKLPMLAPTREVTAIAQGVAEYTVRRFG
jgi:hypothetical protein